MTVLHKNFPNKSMALPKRQGLFRRFCHHVVAKLAFLMSHVANFWQKAHLFNKTVEFKAKTRTRVWKNVRFAWGFC